MRRREFIALLGGTATWPLAARAQQQTLPVIGFVSGVSADTSAERLRLFRQGLNDGGYAEGQNVTVEYHWLGGQYDRLPALMADLVRRRVAVIATAGGPPTLAAKTATTTIPIAFGMPEDPVQTGVVASLARPGGNATGVNFLNAEVAAKRLGLLHDMVPSARRIAVLANPAIGRSFETTQRELMEAATALGVQIRILKATDSREINAAFAALASDPADALFVANDALFVSRHVQLVILAARYAIPASFTDRGYVEAGGLMSYGTDLTAFYRQVGGYAARILKGAKPAETPVIQSSKFELVINLATAQALGLTVPGDLLSIADQVIE